MLIDIKYDRTYNKTTLSNKEYIVTNLIPNLTSERKKQTSEEINDKLFQIFKKYF